jgi:hypothetical protein
MYVHGFIDARHARQFETAWQLGLRSAHLRHVARFVPSRGAIGRAEVLYALLRSRAWRDHELCLYVVPPEVGAGSGALSRFSRLRAALHGTRMFGTGLTATRKWNVDAPCHFCKDITLQR